MSRFSCLSGHGGASFLRRGTKDEQRIVDFRTSALLPERHGDAAQGPDRAAARVCRRAGRHLDFPDQRGAAGGISGAAGEEFSGSASAVRHSVCREGQHRRGGAADDGGLPGLPLSAGTFRPGGGAAGRSRSGPARQDEHGSVRHRPGRGPLPVRGGAEPAGTGICLRRFEQRFRGGAGLWSVQLLPRNRHCRVGSGAGGVQ